jgi:hypothetical protein
VQKMYLEAVRWALRETGEDVTPGPARRSTQRR